MDDLKQRLAEAFNQYQLLTTDAQRAAFWSSIEQQSNNLSGDQKTAFQEVVRANIDQILQRMQTISQQLSVKEAA